MKKINELDKMIGDIIREHLLSVGIQQKEVAEKIGMKQSSFSMMLSGIAPLPIEKLCILISFLRMGNESVNKIFSLYRKRNSIPDDILFMLDGGFIHNRLNELLSIPESELTEINKKEIEVIRYWNNGFRESVSAHTDSANAELIEFVKMLNDVQSEQALKVLKIMFPVGM